MVVMLLVSWIKKKCVIADGGVIKERHKCLADFNPWDWTHIWTATLPVACVLNARLQSLGGIWPASSIPLPYLLTQAAVCYWLQYFRQIQSKWDRCKDGGSGKLQTGFSIRSFRAIIYQRKLGKDKQETVVLKNVKRTGKTAPVGRSVAALPRKHED